MHTIFPATFIRLPVGLPEYRVTLCLSIFPMTLKLASSSVCENAEAIDFVVNIASCILFLPLLPTAASDPVHVPIDPSALITVSIGTYVETVTVAQSFFKVSLVSGAVWLTCYTFTIGEIILPGSFILESI